MDSDGGAIVITGFVLIIVFFMLLFGSSVRSQKMECVQQSINIEVAKLC